MRFLKELFSPEVKCKRIGHKIKTQRLKIKHIPKFGVLEKSWADISRCERCGHIESIENYKRIETYTSASMPTYMWNEIRANGFIET